MIKNLLKSTVEQFIQVIVSTALILGGAILMAANFGPKLARARRQRMAKNPLWRAELAAST